MSLGEKEIQRIFKKYKTVFEEIEHYDQTREKLWARKRIDITLNQRIINKLRELSGKTGKPVSHIIEEAISKI